MFDVKDKNGIYDKPEQSTGEKTHSDSLKEKWVKMYKEFETVFTAL